MRALLARICLLAVLLAVLPGGGPARAETPVLTMAPTLGGGSILGWGVQLLVVPHVLLDFNAGYRPGFVLGDPGRVHSNAAFTLGIVTQFGERPARHGFFVNAASTLPLDSLEAWLAGGWAFSSPLNRDGARISLDLGPAAYLVRDLPISTDLERIPAFVYFRLGIRIPVVSRDKTPTEGGAPP